MIIPPAERHGICRSRLSLHCVAAAGRMKAGCDSPQPGVQTQPRPSLRLIWQWWRRWWPVGLEIFERLLHAAAAAGSSSASLPHPRWKSASPLAPSRSPSRWSRRSFGMLAESIGRKRVYCARPFRHGDSDVFRGDGDQPAGTHRAGAWRKACLSAGRDCGHHRLYQ